jgi:hypothetical protein
MHEPCWLCAALLLQQQQDGTGSCQSVRCLRHLTNCQSLLLLLGVLLLLLLYCPSFVTAQQLPLPVLHP